MAELEPTVTISVKNFLKSISRYVGTTKEIYIAKDGSGKVWLCNDGLPVFYDNDIEFNEDWFLLIPKEFSKHIMINKREVVRLDFVLRRLIGRRDDQ